MRHAGRTVAAIRFASSTRRDLLLEILALRHQLGILARSNRGFRASDRLLWLILRRLWPRWRDALVLVQPATVDRWHRDRFHHCWRRCSRRPGRPRIDSQCRALIRRLAAENRLWGAPRIHGELLKLGIAVSERTVSRYLAGRLRAPSQTWRTFLANHLGQFTSISQVPSLYAPHADDVVEESGLTFRESLLPRDGLYVPDPCAVVAWPASLLRGSLSTRFVQDHLPDGMVIQTPAARGPPTHGRLGRRTVCARSTGHCDEGHGQTIGCRDTRASSTSPGTKRLRLDFGVTCEW